MQKVYKRKTLRKDMVFGFFGSKRKIDKLREEVQDSFNHVRKDVNKIGDWIKHLDDKKERNSNEIDELKEEIKSIKEDINSIKDSISFFGGVVQKREIGHKQRDTNKQTEEASVQTTVQTAVQTSEIDKLTVMERAIIWALLNTDMRLSYEDLSALLGKEKSTIRGQINSIKQKIPGVIEEFREQNGKKRVYISEEMKKNISKKAKLRIKP